ncbi:MAG TPA: hypothetical protein VE998_10180 [Terriglobales bacterium]|nr:hypothetical protein [Terriglobales bacterium]
MRSLRTAAFGGLGIVILALATLHAQSPQQTGREVAPDDASAYSGEYEFLRQGEMLQLTIQPGESGYEKNVTGFISRHGESESDRGTILDHWIRAGTLRANALKLRTTSIHGVWFEFEGGIARGPGASRSERGYYVVEGKLTRHTSDASGRDSAQSREVTLNSLPEDQPK